MTEKQAKEMREQREGRRIDVETANDRYGSLIFLVERISYISDSSE